MPSEINKLFSAKTKKNNKKLQSLLAINLSVTG